MSPENKGLLEGNRNRFERIGGTALYYNPGLVGVGVGFLISGLVQKDLAMTALGAGMCGGAAIGDLKTLSTRYINSKISGH